MHLLLGSMQPMPFREVAVVRSTQDFQVVVRVGSSTCDRYGVFDLEPKSFGATSAIQGCELALVVGVFVKLALGMDRDVLTLILSFGLVGRFFGFLIVALEEFGE